MAQYHLFCKESNAEPCPEHGLYDPVELIREYRETGRRRQYMPELCHFDRQIDLTREQAFNNTQTAARINTEANQHVTTGVLQTGWIPGDAALARAIRNAYRCTRHNSKPEVFRRSYAWSDRRWAVIARDFVQIDDNDIPEDMREWWNALAGWQRPTIYKPRRIIPTLAHIW